MKRRLYYLVPILWTAAALAQEPKLSARADSSQYKIGEWILLHVEAESPDFVQSLVPVVKDSLGPFFEVLGVDTSELRRDANPRRQAWTFRLTTFDSGKVFIPPIPFGYRTYGDTLLRTAFTNPVFVSIAGVAIDPKGDIKDIKPPLDSPWKFEDVLPYLIALICIAFATAAYLYYRKKKKQREEALAPPKPMIPPGEAAIIALRVLEDKRLWQQGRVKEYYSQVTEIVRRFLEHQFGILALESTSDEILQQLKSLPEAGTLLKQFQSFFLTADLVKFAKYEPTPAEHESELRWAYEIVRTMMPRLTQPPVEIKETIDVR
jgi:hypothetical protein